MKEKEYIKLPGKGRKRGISSLFIRNKALLYQAKDHLLCVYNNVFAEDYKRFYFKDIQAITICRTNKWFVHNIILGLCTALLLLMTISFEDVAFIVFSVITGAFLLSLIINWLKGPTCISSLYTAVSKEELPSLNRLKTAEKVLNRLRLSIETAQGKLLSEEIRNITEEIPKRETPVAALRKHSSKVRTGEYFKPYYGRAHEILFIMMLLSGFLSLSKFFINNMLITSLEMMIGSFLGIVLIVAIVKQHSSRMRGGIIGITWITGGYLLLSFIIGYVIFLFGAFKFPQGINTQWNLLRIYSQLSPLDNSFLMAMTMFSTVYSFAAGSAGLFLLQKYRDETKKKI